jgi:polyhydroxybutyrate depolymerase
LACDAADVFAAIAPVAANLSVELAHDCKPSRMISIAIFNGTDDPMMPWLGGDLKVPGTRQGKVISTQDTFELWARIGDCALPITHMERNRVADDNTSLVRHVAHECKNNSEVRLYEILNGGHTWPSGYQYLGQRVIGNVSREINASEEIWRFFAEQGR